MRLLTRRRLLGLFAAGGTALAYTVFVEPYWIEVVRRPLPIAGLPEGLEGKTLVQLSDLHAGVRVPDGYLLRAFELVNSLEADIVTITGDWMSSKGSEEVDRVRRLISRLEPGRLGTFGILGNHDYGTGWWVAEAGDKLLAGLRDEGVTMLRHQRADAGGLGIVGLDDLWGPYWSRSKAAQAIAGPGPALVLCHNPDALDQPIWGDYRGWVLSGHTHGGQGKPPFLPPPFIPVKNKRYQRGEVALEDGRRVYINRALGFILPLRLNARPEITVFTLTRA
ncbi:MAG: metallophosphoesterase [Gemmataceae bacterium]|nr:metallophosphoesterase [Gemmataceae bacterium]